MKTICIPIFVLAFGLCFAETAFAQEGEPGGSEIARLTEAILQNPGDAKAYISRGKAWYTIAETSLPEGVHPEARLQASAALRGYIRERVKVEFDGIDQSDGLIAEALDERTGQLDEIATIGNLLVIHGSGLLKNLREVRSEFKLTAQVPQA